MKLSKYCLFSIVLIGILFIQACTQSEDSPEKTLQELSKALQENRKDDALNYIDEPSKDRYNKLFTTIGSEGMSDYGAMLSSLTLSKKTDDEAEFTGIWNVSDKELDVKARFRKARQGVWKLRVIE